MNIIYILIPRLCSPLAEKRRRARYQALYPRHVVMLYRDKAEWLAARKGVAA